MPRYIDADNLKLYFNYPIEYSYAYINKMINAAPTIDIREINRGRWVHPLGGAPYCSRCGNETVFAGSGRFYCGAYCQSCGAKMDEEVNIFDNCYQLFFNIDLEKLKHITINGQPLVGDSTPSIENRRG